MFFFTVFFPFLHFFQSQRKQSLASDSEKERAARTEWGQAQQITNYKHLHRHNVPLSPECLKCFDMHLTAHASVKCPFSKSNILHVPLLTHLLAAAIHQQKCHDSRGSVDAEGRQICIWNGRMQMIASGSPDRTAKGEQKEGLLGEGCWTARQASWVFTLQTASSQRGESARKRKKKRERERDMGWKRVRQRALFWIVFSQLVLTKHPLFAKLSLCFTWQWQRLYFLSSCLLSQSLQ